jgi:hypothetical protein
VTLQQVMQFHSLKPAAAALCGVPCSHRRSTTTTKTNLIAIGKWRLLIDEHNEESSKSTAFQLRRIE